MNKLLQIRNGHVTADVSGQVKLPEDFCKTVLNPRKLNDKVYPDIENTCVLHADYFNCLCESNIGSMNRQCEPNQFGHS